jgi:hypothetical protein
MDGWFCLGATALTVVVTLILFSIGSGIKPPKP